jgi:hypothetical protein
MKRLMLTLALTMLSTTTLTNDGGTLDRYAMVVAPCGNVDCAGCPACAEIAAMQAADDAGCEEDAPLPPSAARAVEARRARLGASDPGGDIKL